MAARILAAIERGQPGGSPGQDGDLAKQLDDLLQFCLGVRTQFGSMDLVLRGAAVACASDTQTSNAQRYLRTLVRTGVRVWVDATDLAELGCPESALMDGVTTADTDAMARSWHEYREVWFL